MKTTILLMIVGATLFGYSLTMSPYKNEKLFNERYLSMSAGQSEEYWRLRDEMLTPKFQLQDYGVTLVAMAVAFFLVTRKGYVELKSHKSRKVLFVLAITLPLLTVCAYLFDIMQAFKRGEFPHWADSIGIPLMGAPFQLIILLIWSFGHLYFARGGYPSSIPLVCAVSFKSNWWLLLASAFIAILVLLFTICGLYWYAIPGVFWLYFYTSLLAINRAKANT